ncbi:hypothetical protein [Dyella sp.]|uniref:hypothetical protein n=1 Tax=Dyella sp. TaxID=1869338 RepID=UPI002ED5F9DD
MEFYLTAGNIAFIVGVAMLLALRFNVVWLANLSVAVLDIKPLLLFLLGWCLIRTFELTREQFFKPRHRDGRFARRLRKSTVDASVIMVGAYLGAIGALVLRGAKDSEQATFPAYTLIVLILCFPFWVASGVSNPRRQGASMRVKRWSGVLAGVIFLTIMGATGHIDEKKEALHGDCPATGATQSRDGSDGK